MSKIAVDEVREERILMEVVVDAYDAEERGMGWYYYLEDKIQFPFAATCITTRRTSPLKQGAQVEVVGLADGDDCMHEMFVEIVWGSETLAIPLSQIQPIEPNEDTQEAIADWHYWVGRGYEFG